MPALPPVITPPTHLTAFEQQLWAAREDPFYSKPEWDSLHWHRDADALWRTGLGQLVIPPGPLRYQVMEACHDSVYSGHFGAAKTDTLVRRLFFWPTMGKNIKSYCKSCPICTAVKAGSHKPEGAIQPLPVPDHKWSHISTDMVTDLPVTLAGFDAILVFVDRLTKMVHLVPCEKSLDA
jgi:hypothetical protein